MIPVSTRLAAALALLTGLAVPVLPQAAPAPPLSLIHI